MIKPQVCGRKKQQEEGGSRTKIARGEKTYRLDREEYKPWSFSEGQNNELRPFDADCDSSLFGNHEREGGGRRKAPSLRKRLYWMKNRLFC